MKFNSANFKLLGCYYPARRLLDICKNYSKYSRDVYVAQIALNRINSLYSTANCGAGGADGYFGNNTYTGVKAFQTFWNNTKGSSLYYMIGVDGVIGNCTWACISYYST